MAHLQGACAHGVEKPVGNQRERLPVSRHKVAKRL
jgi:hypothetical protein